MIDDFHSMPGQEPSILGGSAATSGNEAAKNVSKTCLSTRVMILEDNAALIWQPGT